MIEQGQRRKAEGRKENRNTKTKDLHYLKVSSAADRKGKKSTVPGAWTRKPTKEGEVGKRIGDCCRKCKHNHGPSSRRGDGKAGLKRGQRNGKIGDRGKETKRRINEKRGEEPQSPKKLPGRES